MISFRSLHKLHFVLFKSWNNLKIKIKCEMNWESLLFWIEILMLYIIEAIFKDKRDFVVLEKVIQAKLLRNKSDVFFKIWFRFSAYWAAIHLVWHSHFQSYLNRTLFNNVLFTSKNCKEMNYIAYNWWLLMERIDIYFFWKDDYTSLHLVRNFQYFELRFMRISIIGQF